MYQGFSGDFDSASRCSSSPSEPQYLSSVDSFSQSIGSPTTAAQECTTGVGEMPGSFVPTLTAITTSQDLQWMVQPTVISSVAQTQSHIPPMAQTSMDPYNLPGTSYSTPAMCSYSTGEPSKPTRASRSRRARDETLTAEEEEKRRVRRERNKLAAAKCRNRRRELTDRLQTETDQLEEEKAELQSQIAELHKEKERLEFVLVAHKPACKIPFQDPVSPQPSAAAAEEFCPHRTPPVWVPMKSPGTVQRCVGSALRRVPLPLLLLSVCQLSSQAPGVVPFEEVWNRSYCRTIEVLVDVVREYPSQSEYIFKPSCVPLLRCAGCCGDEKLRCTAREMYNVTIQVIKLKPLEHVTKQEEMIFTEHSSCECRPRRKRLKGDRSGKRKGHRRRTKLEDEPELNQLGTMMNLKISTITLDVTMRT
ncbi:protein FosB-like isoform X3 [Mobula hypostoma]|uniref:protein FosB-like isoform X3 n=1 Tax=Mobula hypostoma TaxID=723540 RepID=UPI002FC2EA9B